MKNNYCKNINDLNTSRKKQKKNCEYKIGLLDANVVYSLYFFTYTSRLAEFFLFLKSKGFSKL